MILVFVQLFIHIAGINSNIMTFSLTKIIYIYLNIIYIYICIFRLHMHLHFFTYI